MAGYATAVRNAKLQAIVTAIDAGSGNGTLTLYNGTKPATGAAITTQVALADLTFPKPSGTITGGVLTFGTITADPSANVTGTATWLRIKDSAGTFVADFTVGTSSAEVIITTTSVVSGQQVSITGFTITDGDP